MTTLSTKMLRALCAVACTAALAACGTTAPVAAPAKPALQDMLSQATQASTAGQKEKAVTIWKDAGAAYPTDKTPWINIAQTRYEASLWGEAIIAAQEALLRDPNDKLANSIIATSGLRLSIRALSDLTRQNNLLPGSLRTESQDLAKLLRETLNEDKIFSEHFNEKSNVVAKPPSGNTGKSSKSSGPKLPRPESAPANPLDLLGSGK